MTEALGIARHEGVQEFLDLTKELGAFINEIAAMASQQLDSAVGFGPSRFEQTEAMGGRAEDGGEIGVVSFVAGIGGLAILLGGEGVDESRLEASVAEGALNGAVIVAGHFDGDDAIAHVGLGDGELHTLDGGREVAPGMSHGGRFEENTAIEVGEEIARARFGAIDSEDAEVLRPDGLDAGGEEAVGLLQAKRLGGLGGGTVFGTSHGHSPFEVEDIPPCPQEAECTRDF
jgi:hypothetical protein